MKVKVPHIKVTLAVKTESAGFSVTEKTIPGKFTMTAAKAFIEDKANWENEWQEVKVIDVAKADNVAFEVPAADLFQFCKTYVDTHTDTIEEGGDN